MLLGKAHHVDEDGNHTHENNVWVLKQCRVLPVHLELQVRRLKWLASILRDPASAGSLLAAWLGVAWLGLACLDLAWLWGCYEANIIDDLGGPLRGTLISGS